MIAESGAQIEIIIAIIQKAIFEYFRFLNLYSVKIQKKEKFDHYLSHCSIFSSEEEYEYERIKKYE